jgi:hypothetical protein
MYGRFLSFFGSGALALALPLDEEVPVSFLRKGQRPVMVAVGRGGGALLLDMATGSSSYKREKDAVSEGH